MSRNSSSFTGLLISKWHPFGRGLRCAAGAVLFISLVAGLAGCGNSIHDLSRWGEMDKVRQILEANPEAVHERDALDKTPLFFAVTFDKPEMVRLLLEHGADINAKDITGMTPLHVAANLGLNDQVRLLVELGADLNARDEFGDTPLHAAAYSRYLKDSTLRLLVELGADLNAENKAGLTPEELARDKALDEAAEVLAELRGTQEPDSINISDNEGN